MQAESLTQAAVILLVLRAFSSGCSALTGVEAVANGVPAFRKPKVRNAQTTLALMGGIAIVLFAGLTALALISGVHYAENPCNLIGFDCENNPQPSLMAQVAAATFGMGSIPFFIIQAATACVLLLAANTAFNGFPLLGSVLARDGYAPKALNTRGDRLVYSNGMIILGIVAIGVLVVYQANLTTLIQLYIIGVFASFSFGQIGMVRHWRRTAARDDARRGEAATRAARRERRSATQGPRHQLGRRDADRARARHRDDHEVHARRVPGLHRDPDPRVLMIGVNRYYRDVEHEIQMDDTMHFGASGDVAIILVNRLQKPVAEGHRLRPRRQARQDRSPSTSPSRRPRRTPCRRNGKSTGCRSRS